VNLLEEAGEKESRHN